jgi:hypothetical protein
MGRYEKKYSSNYRGVCFDVNRWKATIFSKKAGGRIFLGSFATEIEAAEAYNKKAIELNGESAKLNVISEDSTKTQYKYRPRNIPVPENEFRNLFFSLLFSLPKEESDKFIKSEEFKKLFLCMAPVINHVDIKSPTKFRDHQLMPLLEMIESEELKKEFVSLIPEQDGDLCVETRKRMRFE